MHLLSFVGLVWSTNINSTEETIRWTRSRNPQSHSLAIISYMSNQLRYNQHSKIFTHKRRSDRDGGGKKTRKTKQDKVGRIPNWGRLNLAWPEEHKRIFIFSNNNTKVLYAIYLIFAQQMENGQTINTRLHTTEIGLSVVALCESIAINSRYGGSIDLGRLKRWRERVYPEDPSHWP